MVDTSKLRSTQNWAHRAKLYVEEHLANGKLRSPHVSKMILLT